MIGCNSTDEELEEREREHTRYREERLKELEVENASLRDEIRTLEAEKSQLESLIDRLENELEEAHVDDHW